MLTASAAAAGAHVDLDFAGLGGRDRLDGAAAAAGGGPPAGGAGTHGGALPRDGLLLVLQRVLRERCVPALERCGTTRDGCTTSQFRKTGNADVFSNGALEHQSSEHRLRRRLEHFRSDSLELDVIKYPQCLGFV